MSIFLSLFILGGVFVTSLLSGVLGMAGGMMLMGLLVWVLPVQQAMMLHATAQVFANGSRAFIHREHLHKTSIGYYLLGLAITFAAFCVVTFLPNKTIVFLLLGISPFIPLLLGNKVRFDFTVPGQAFFCGVIVSCFHLTGGVSGPMLDMFFQKIPMTRHQVVSTKAFTQTISHTAKFIYFGAVVPQALDLPAGPPLWLFCAVIPVAIAGSHLSKRALNKITDKQFYIATQWLLWAIGVVYLVKAALLLQGGGS